MRCLRLVSMFVVLFGLVGSAEASFLQVTDPLPLPATRAFGVVPINTSATATVTIRSCQDNSGSCGNNNGSNTDLTSFTFGAGCGEFTLTTPPSPVLPITIVSQPGSAVAFTFTYHPTNVGTDSCSVTANASGGDSGTSFTLTGTAGLSALEVTVPAPPMALSFADQNWRSGTGETKTITIRNTGTLPIAVGNMTVTSSDPAQFAVGAVNAFPIAAGGVPTATVPITFNPTSNGAHSATITFSVDNDNGAADLTVTVQGNGTQSIATVPASVVFNAHAVGTADTAALTVMNTGTAALNISSISIAAPFASDFAFTDHGCSGQSCSGAGLTPIAMGASDMFMLSCTPGAPGLRAAVLTITSDDGVATTDVVALKCTGNNLSLGPDKVGGGTTVAQNVTVANAGTAPLMYSVSSSNPEFAVTCAVSCMNRTLAAGTSETHTVTFQASMTGPRMANLVFTTDDPDTNLQVVTLTGTGTAPAVTLLQPATPPLDLGNVPVLTTSAAGTIQIRNSGTATLEITSATLTGGDAAQFTIASGGVGPQSLATATNLSWTVTCRPTSAGPNTTTFRVAHDASGGMTDVTLNCTGTVPDVTIAPPSIAFGSQRLGTQSGIQVVTVSNAAGATVAPLTWSATLTGAGAAHFSMACTVSGAPACTCAAGTCSGTRNAGLSTTLDIRFAPTAAGVGAQAATVQFMTNDPDTPMPAVMLTGTGIRALTTLVMPVPATPPTTGGVHAFGDVRINTTAPARTIRLQNTGDDVLTVSAVTNTNAGGYDLTGPALPLTIMPNMTADWTVACDPEARGATNGQIRIVNDSANDTSVDVDLTCNSIEAVLAATANPVAINAGTMNFGATAIGTMKTSIVTITNSGNTPATIASVVLATMPAQGFSVTGFNPNTVVNGNNGTTTFTVVFNPMADADGMNTLNLDSDWNDLTINLTGDGQPVGAEITPSPVTLGNVRWDQSADQVMTVRNTQVAPFRVTAASLTGPDAAEFQIVGFTPSATDLTQNQSMTFTVRANPSDAVLGVRNATLNVTTTLPPAPGLVLTVPLTYTSVGPALTLDPGMVVDFGDVDVDDAAGKTIMLQVTNAGTGLMTVSNFGSIAAGPFTKVNPASNTAAPGNMLTIPITYKPTVERETSETATFTVTTTGLFAGTPPTAGPPSFQVTLRGRGVDQHIQVADVTFSDTYRNPTDAQVAAQRCGAGHDQPCEVRVCNTGRAALNVAMFTDPDDEFDLATTQALAVPGRGDGTSTCMAVAVAFRPTSYGAKAGTVTVFNDDNGQAMAQVDLTGMGIPRPVNVEPAAITRARIAIGSSIRLTDISGVRSGIVLGNSAAEPFGVALAVVDGGTTSVVGDTTTLAASGSASFDLALDTSRAGMFDIKVEVHLDGDPEPHHTVTVPIEVVDLDLQGGGCSSGGAGAGVLVGLASLGLLFRGRRRALAGLAALAAVALGAAPARAQVSVGQLDISTFTPAASTEPAMFSVLSPAIGKKGAWALDLVFDNAANPLVNGSAGGNDDPVTRRTSVDLGFAFALSRKLELGVGVPLHNQVGDEGCSQDCMDGLYGTAGASGTTLGDIAVRAKARLGGALGAALTVTAPTAKAGQFAGSELPTAHLQLLAGVAAGKRLNLALNAGFRARPGSEMVLGAKQGSDVTFGGAASLRALEDVWAVGEAYGSIGVVGAEGKVNPMVFVLGIRYRVARALVFGAGGGGGFGHGIGVPDFRAFASIAVAPGAGPVEPLRPPPPPPPPKDMRDNDGDGIVNADDQCPEEAEDKDGFADNDGCAEVDNDGDGIPDASDKCVNEPEDKDGTDDADGCADPDDDGDGVPDMVDKCPKEPEDPDGYQDGDGCDEPDNDKDGVPDVLDQCALEPETINGNKDDDGCPDSGDSLVMVMQDRIEALEPITFVGTTAKLNKGAANVIGQIGATLRADATIRKIRVTVHVHPRGGGDQSLSDKRAEEIRKALLATGVEPERVDARGIGSQRPLVAKTAKGAEQINDRVEFIILERR